MRLVTFRRTTGAPPRLGALVNDRIVDLNTASGATVPADMLGFLRGGDDARAAAAAALAQVQERDRMEMYPALADVDLLPPVPNPGKFLCLGLNYRDHIAETGRPMPTFPTFFVRFPTSLIGNRAPIVRPKVSEKLDWEAELSVVIGRQGRHIPRERAMEYVAGCTIFNDGSVRDFQNHTSQWTAGKNFDSTGPMGPYLALLDEGYDPANLDVRLWVNNELMQSSNTRHLVHDISEAVAYISQVCTLEPGDVIATGTCGGVGQSRQPPVFLKNGDRVAVEITGLGRLENPVVDE